MDRPSSEELPSDVSGDFPDLPAAALAEAGEGIALLDRDGIVVGANPAFDEAHGVDPGSLTGEPWAGRYADPAAARAGLAAAGDGGWEGELDLATPDGEARTVSVVLSAAGDGRTVAFVRDVTDSVRRRRDLEWYETVLGHVRDPVYALDDEGRITYVNDSLLEEYGVDDDREELIGEHVSAVLAPEDVDRSLSLVRELRDDPERDSGRCEVTIRTGDGAEVPAELHVALLPPDARHGPGVVGVVRDVTERKRREQGLSVLQRVLRHNVRNETGAIMGYAEQLRDVVPEDERGKLDRIHAAAAELGRVSEKARHVQAAVDAREVTPGPVDVAAVLDQRRVVYRKRYPRIDLRIDTPESAWAHTGDSLDVVVDELVDNAIEHAEDDSPRVSITVSVYRDGEGAGAGDRSGAAGDGDHGDLVVVRVDDDGPGIPQEELTAIARGREDPLYHGSGLGLWLVRWFVETHGGEVRFDESEWGGTSVRIAMPGADPGWNG